MFNKKEEPRVNTYELQVENEKLRIKAETFVKTPKVTGGTRDVWGAACNEICIASLLLPIYETEQEAIEAWNTRTPQKEG